MKHLSSIILLVFGLLSCEELDVVNPADPSYELNAPTLVSATSVTDSQIELVWKNNEAQVREFIVQRKSASIPYSNIATVNKDVLYYSDTNCELGKNYSYAILSKVEGNLSESSNSITLSTSFPAPIGAFALAESDASIGVTWTDNYSYEDSFVIERNSGIGFEQLIILPADAVTFIDSGLLYGIDYAYRIAAITSRNNSNWSIITTANTTINKPSDVLATAMNGSEIELNWVDNCNYETGYIVERRNRNTTFTQVEELQANTSVYIDSALISGSAYIYRVFAITESNSSYYSLQSASTPYAMVQVGEQVWMTENLQVIKYRDNTEITHLTSDEDWSNAATGGYCTYDNSDANIDTYGRLYNWYAVVNNRNLAPEGWHLPSDSEWQVLVDYLGGAGLGGGKLKEEGIGHWASPNTGATNQAKFNALPSGYRSSAGAYHGLSYGTHFWSTTELNSTNSLNRTLYYNSAGMNSNSNGMRYGFSIRCLRN